MLPGETDVCSMSWVPQGQIYSEKGRQPGPLYSLLTTNRGRNQKQVLPNRAMGLPECLEQISDVG